MEDIDFSWPNVAELLSQTFALLPVSKPRVISCRSLSEFFTLIHVQDDVLIAFECGFDFFNVAFPSSMADDGLAFSDDYQVLDMRSDSFKKDTRPLADSCDCMTCRKHSRAYLYHLVQVREILGFVLLMW